MQARDSFLSHLPLTQEAAGSSPIAAATFLIVCHQVLTPSALKRIMVCVAMVSEFAANRCPPLSRELLMTPDKRALSQSHNPIVCHQVLTPSALKRIMVCVAVVSEFAVNRCPPLSRELLMDS